MMEDDVVENGTGDEFEAKLEAAAKTGMLEVVDDGADGDEASDDNPTAEQAEKTPEQPDPQAIIDAFAEAVARKLGSLGQKETKGKEPVETEGDDGLEALLKQQEELKERIVNAAGGDEAISGLVDMVSALQKRILEKEVRERKEAEARQALESDMARIREDIDEVEREFGVKLPPLGSPEFHTLLQTAMSVRLNPLKEAYRMLYGAKGVRPTALDSGRKPSGPEAAEYAVEVAELARRVGLKPDEVLKML